MPSYSDQTTEDLRHAIAHTHFIGMQEALRSGANLNSKNAHQLPAVVASMVAITDALKKENSFKKEWAEIIIEGHLPIMELLLNQGANVNAQNNNGATALLLAMQLPDTLNRHRVINKLLRAGANPNLCNINNLSPLFAACSNSDIPTVRLLLSHGASVHETSPGLNPMLATLTSKKGVSLLKILVKHGADLHPKNETPFLFYAIMANYTTMVKWLLPHYKDLTMHNQQQKTLLEVATTKTMQTMIREEILRREKLKLAEISEPFSQQQNRAPRL